MNLLKIKSITNGQRHQVVLQKNLLSKNNKILKNLTLKQNFAQGRSTTTGQITVRHKGGGCKLKIRNIEKSNFMKKAILLAILYNPGKNNLLSLMFDIEKKKFFYLPTTLNVYPGTFVCTNNVETELYLGYRESFKKIPAGSLVHEVNNKSKKNIYARSAGTFCQLVQRTLKNCVLKLPSGKYISMSVNAFATIGTSANTNSNLKIKGKAGKNRLLGIRPTVRGIAMNPVDHPHGGRTNGGIHWVTPWGISTKGKKTVKKK